MAQSSSFLRNILILLIIIQVAPTAFKTAKNFIENTANPKQKVGLIILKETITDSTQFVGQLKTFMEQKDIAAVVIKADCPGGAPGASQAMYDAIRMLKEQHHKPIVSWIQNVCASGGYYVVSATDWIIATPSALVGSIGVIWPQFNLEKLREQYNLDYTATHAGSYKTSTDMFVRKTAEQTKLLQNLVDGVYERFISDVRLARPQLIEDPKVWADAKIFNGDQALKVKLIDEVGNQLIAEAAVKRLANITTEIEWVRPSRKPAWMKWFGMDDSGDDDHPSMMVAFVNTLISSLGLTPRQSYPQL